jgi:choline-glycine betaine transporter
LLTGSDAAVKGTFAENQPSALSGSYHNGPLSVVMTFGIWGVIAFVWFWIAAIWVLYNNYRRGDPALRTVNTFLLVAFVGRIIYFMSIFGDVSFDILTFGGFLGLSVSLNGGVSRPAPQPARATKKFRAVDDIRPHLQPTFRRP